MKSESRPTLQAGAWGLEFQSKLELEHEPQTQRVDCDTNEKKALASGPGRHGDPESSE